MGDLIIPVVAGLAAMPNLISGSHTTSVGTSYCAPTSSHVSCGYVPARTSPIYATPCGHSYGHSTAYNYGVYPVSPGYYTPRAYAAYRGAELGRVEAPRAVTRTKTISVTTEEETTTDK